jgi:electron transfer flavoprotein alpha subunit
MSNDVLVVVEHEDGQVTDTSLELLGKAKELAASFGGRAVGLVLGDRGVAEQLRGADLALVAEDPRLAPYSGEAWEAVLVDVVRQRDPRLVLLGTTTTGLDLGPALGVAWSAPVVSYVVDLAAEGGALVATAQIYGGKLRAEVAVTEPRCVGLAIAGSFAPADGGAPEIEVLAPPPALDALRTSVVATFAPEGGDVDITAADLLVSVGRGIGSQDNLEVVEELAAALGAPLSASRPLIDQGWLPKSRQVGKSGLKVKPKAYVMLGISGAPEHIEGMRDAELIIACNTDPQAPIFDVAHYGTTVDLFDLVPAMVDLLA